MPATKQSWLHKKLKLSRHEYTGRRLPVEHTSRGVLLILALAVAAMVLYVNKSYSSNAAALTGQGSLGLSGLVKPIGAPGIEQPLNKQAFSVKQISVSGTCPTFPLQTTVNIIDNGVVAGSTPCNDGLFQLKIDLLPAANNISAVSVDIFGRSGPDSTVLKITYNYPYSPARAFNISSEPQSYNVIAGRSFSLGISISGGYAPYAFNVSWGDGSNDVISRADASSFVVTHSYKTAAQYEITVVASDGQGRKVQSQSAVIISGPSPVGVGVASPAGAQQQPYGESTLQALLPASGLVVAGVFVFWLGEIYERNLLMNLPKTTPRPAAKTSKRGKK